MPSERRVKPYSAECREAYMANRVVNSKYTMLSFIPKNIYEQFGRPLNMYFLLIAGLQLIKAIAPVNPLSTIVPLVFAFALTAIKEGFDDRERHREDSKFNNRKYEVFVNGSLKQIASEDIHVGDVVKVNKGNEIPCDLFLLQSSDEDGLAYIRTDNLDGEIDLKPRNCVENLTIPSITDFNGILVYGEPDNNLYSFNSRLEHDKDYTVSGAQLLLQSCFLQNTEWVYGLAVYTGSDTKCGQNKQDPPLKWAGVDRLVSHFASYVFIFQLSVALFMGIIGNVYRETKSRDAWYLSFKAAEAYEYLVIPMRFFLLTSVMIPISFKVIIDVSKYYISLVIGWDISMYDADIDAPAGSPAKANSTSLAEDLGQIECILTDKTGTLTDNIMEFKACSLSGEICGGGIAPGKSFDPSVSPFDGLGFAERTDAPYRLFAKTLALCHTVNIEDGNLAAASPDEEALVKAASRMRVRFIARTKHTITIDNDGVTEVYKILHVFEFDSDRKMMSMLLQNNETGETMLLSKGADDKLIAKMDETQLTAPMEKHLCMFASAGLRTLVLGHRTVSQSEYNAWREIIESALKHTGDTRDVEVAKAYTILESKLTLVGATAIEDKLQDGVPETIVKLREAGISFWMLTGDKFETAKQISRSCGLWTANESLLTISYETDVQMDNDLRRLLDICERNHSSLAETLNEQYGTFHNSSLSNKDDELQAASSAVGESKLEIAASEGPTDGHVLIVEGKTIKHLLEKHITLFKELCMKMNSVICCRVTPSQKAGLTRMAKTDIEFVEDAGCFTNPLRRGKTDRKVLSVGDGGNDVAMIQEATVGVGIVGKEGRQASRAADYSIARFRFLQPLLLVHGQYSYQRSCYIVQYCFYKSMLLAIIQIIFNFFALFSGVSYWNSLLLTTWNSVFAVPVPFYVLDKILPKDKLLANPDLYKESLKGKSLTMNTFGWFVGRGAIQGIMCLLFTFIVFNDSVSNNAQPMDFQSCFTVTYTILVMVQVWTVILESNSMTVVNLVGIFSMPPFYLAFIAAYAAIPVLSYYGVATRLFSDPAVWLAVILLTAALFVPSYSYAVYQENFRPTPFQVIRRRAHPVDPILSGPSEDFANLETSTTSPLARHE
eukprot:TRINITY_DN9775_c0_g1_i3.p1 TRINITY_DN9775_c0_g1~~TRINITY_DN9775_c0_g1_i3.p1  ORF type:complete len:1134 (+),score=217.97 TRINITY_DN9775_c0_g1_i3:48-3404(+)